MPRPKRGSGRPSLGEVAITAIAEVSAWFVAIAIGLGLVTWLGWHFLALLGAAFGL
jgi:hypothetical protein